MNKKLLSILIAFFYSVSLIFLPQSKALAKESSSGDVLNAIRVFTFQTAHYAQMIDEKLNLSLIFMNQWLITPNDSDHGVKTSEIQANFSTYTNTDFKTQAINDSLQRSLTNEFLGPTVTPKSAPYANDLTYQTLLGQPYFSLDPRELQGDKNVDSARNYIKNIAGLSITHFLPKDNWKGTDINKQKYKNFYNTVSSIQTFNSHVLGEIYADYKSDGAASGQQSKLVQQASNSEWFATVASEPIGLVLRQILMYTSQLLAVNTQQLKTQKEILQATTMTNTLAILGNQFNETLLLNRATGQTQ